MQVTPRRVPAGRATLLDAKWVLHATPRMAELGFFTSWTRTARSHDGIDPRIACGMALTATVYSFDVQLNDLDRGVYESLAFKAAQHPSESEEYLVARVLAYCLEYREGISFGKGLHEPDEPALTITDLSGARQAWIEIGAPDADRLHRASKASPRVVVYTHKDPATLLRQLEEERIHRKEAIAVVALDRDLVAALVERLDRRMSFTLMVSEDHLFITLGDETLEGGLTRIPLA